MPRLPHSEPYCTRVNLSCKTTSLLRYFGEEATAAGWEAGRTSATFERHTRFAYLGAGAAHVVHLHIIIGAAPTLACTPGAANGSIAPNYGPLEILQGSHPRSLSTPSEKRIAMRKVSVNTNKTHIP